MNLWIARSLLMKSDWMNIWIQEKNYKEENGMKLTHCIKGLWLESRSGEERKKRKKRNKKKSGKHLFALKELWEGSKWVNKYTEGSNWREKEKVKCILSVKNRKKKKIAARSRGDMELKKYVLLLLLLFVLPEQVLALFGKNHMPFVVCD